MHRKVAAIVAAVLALGAAGCGGGDGGGEDSLTRAEFVKQADAVCKRAQTLPAAEGERPTLVEFGERTLASRRTMLARLEQLEPPEQMASRYDRYLAAVRENDELNAQVLERFRAAKDGKVPQDDATLALTERRDDAAATATAIGKKLGLKVCTA
jgi:hypothetical protein